MSIKEEGKAVTLDHIQEKVKRDCAFLNQEVPSDARFEEALASLVKDGLLSRDPRGFYRKPVIDAQVEGLVRRVSGSLNRSYLLVYLAERYYPHVVHTMLPYLVDRPIAAVKVFSGKKDPIGEVESIFVRYSKYKPHPVQLSVKDSTDVMRLVHDHCVDFVPYVQGFDGRPNVFLVDLDLGEQLATRSEGLAAAKVATLEVDRILRSAGCHPLIKFSGNRGFQVLCRLSPDSRTVDFAALRNLVRTLQGSLESTLQKGRGRELEALGLSRPFTTSSVDDKKSRAGKILVDWSSMKPRGDYRAPLSIHYKTGLASIPLEPEEVMGFQREDADPLSLTGSSERLSFAKELRETSLDSLESLGSKAN